MNAAACGVHKLLLINQLLNEALWSVFVAKVKVKKLSLCLIDCYAIRT
jgi:hypothetical protein